MTRRLPPPQFNIDSESLPTVHAQLQAFREDISQPLQLDIFVDTSQCWAETRKGDSKQLINIPLGHRK